MLCGTFFVVVVVKYFSNIKKRFEKNLKFRICESDDISPDLKFGSECGNCGWFVPFMGLFCH